MDLANYTSPLNTFLLILILFCISVVVITIIIILNTLINGITTIVNKIEAIPIIPPKKYPHIIYTHYLPNNFPFEVSNPFNNTLAIFLCKILMSCTNESLNEDPFLPEGITISAKWPHTYLLQIEGILILVFLEIPFDLNGIQSEYRDLNGKICGMAKVGRNWNQIYNGLKMVIYDKIISIMGNSKIIVTGYGTGASLASLMATALGIEGLNICYYGIGSLRCGNNEFYECMAHSVSNRWDILNLMDPYIDKPNLSTFSNSNHRYNLNTNMSDERNNHDLNTYLCGLEPETCSSEIQWNSTIYSGNIKV